MFGKFLAATFLASAILASAGALAQQMDHMTHTPQAGAPPLPTEPGDGAFAAIAEVVQILMQDPGTDWARVDIAALREHLVDMNHLTLAAEVEAVPLADGLSMRISRAGRAGDAATRMVPAHVPFLLAQTRWQSEVEVGDDAIVWTVRGATEADAVRIRALGFFGLMTIGDHHRVAHMAIARGQPMH